MMAFRILIVSTLTLLLALAGCGDDTAETSGTATTDEHAGHDHGPAESATAITAEVVETMDAGGYTYVRVEDDGHDVWAAGPQTEVAVGDEVTIATAMPMPNFHSESLDRDFELLYFVNSFDGSAGAGGMGAMGAMGDMGDRQHPEPAPAAEVDLSGIAKAEGGYTVAEVHEKASDLSGESVRVQGKVVKYLQGIMGTNWLHVRDGSGSEGANDLTVTTDGFAQVGDLVLIEGTLATEKDFGAGYRYEVIVEDASVTKK